MKTAQELREAKVEHDKEVLAKENKRIEENKIAHEEYVQRRLEEMERYVSGVIYPKIENVFKDSTCVTISIPDSDARVHDKITEILRSNGYGASVRSVYFEEEFNRDYGCRTAAHTNYYLEVTW